MPPGPHPSVSHSPAPTPRPLPPLTPFPPRHPHHLLAPCRLGIKVYYIPHPPADSCPLYSMDNVLMMPHMGGPTIDRRQAVTRSVLSDIRSFLEGKPMSGEISRAYAENMSQY